MENYSDMTSINNINHSSQIQPAMKSASNDGNTYNTEAHYSKDMKVKRPKVIPAQAPDAIPKSYSFSNNDADKKMQEINTDIYKKASKEKSKHEFNRSLYFKIFGGITLLAAGIAGVSKIRKWLGRGRG